MLKEAIKLQSRELELAETPKSEPPRPVKAKADTLKPGAVATLQALVDREDLRKRYEEQEWRLLAEKLSTEAELLAAEAREDLCAQILLLVELATEVSTRLLFLKVVFLLVLDFKLLSQKANGKLKPHPILQSACKLAYMPSKAKANDSLFHAIRLIEILYEILVKLLSDELVELEGGEHSVPFQTLVYLVGTLKNLTDDESGRQQALDVGLVVVLARLLPLPADFAPSTHPEYV